LRNRACAVAAGTLTIEQALRAVGSAARESRGAAVGSAARESRGRDRDRVCKMCSLAGKKDVVFGGV
jgi:hypothetical protein